MEFQYMSYREMILKRSYRFVGSSENKPRTVRCFSDGKMVYKTVDLSEAVERCFDEILQNAGEFSIAPTIIVQIDSDTISIENECNIRNIKRKIDQNKELTIAELISGTVGFGLNCDNHYGSGLKIVNIMSDEFIFELGDNDTGIYQKITYRNNMSSNESITIPNEMSEESSRYKGRNYVKVTWKMDLRGKDNDKNILDDKISFTPEDVEFFYCNGD